MNIFFVHRLCDVFMYMSIDFTVHMMHIDDAMNMIFCVMMMIKYEIFCFNGNLFLYVGIVICIHVHKCT